MGSETNNLHCTTDLLALCCDWLTCLTDLSKYTPPVLRTVGTDVWFIPLL